MGGTTSISTILLVDVDVGSFSPYKYVPTPWANFTKILNYFGKIVKYNTGSISSENCTFSKTFTVILSKVYFCN